MKIQDKKYTLLRTGENITKVFLENNFKGVSCRNIQPSEELETKSFLKFCGYTESLFPEKRGHELMVYMQDTSSDEDIEEFENFSPEELAEFYRVEEEFRLEDIEELQVS